MDEDDILRRLQQPLARPPEDPSTFRLGIVLNGTVSAGAWTAGVLDFLVEALDAWEAAKRAGEDVPGHRVRLDILGGVSGGGVCAALLARAASCRFPHARDGGGAAGNPFWRVWVETLDIEAMLSAEDLADPAAPVASLLDGRAIDLAGSALLDWGPGTAPGVTRLETRRAWLADPFRVLVTLTNLRGVPYRIQFAPAADGSPRASYYVDHADHALFAFPFAPGGTPEAHGLRGDEWLVGSDLAGADRAAWEDFAAYAKATGAFPGGFPPRRLARPTAHYDWRAAFVPADSGEEEPAAPRLRRPAWDELPAKDRPGATYVFDCVDGGALNNQPVELVRHGRALQPLGQPGEAARAERPRRAEQAVAYRDAPPRDRAPAPAAAHRPRLVTRDPGVREAAYARSWMAPTLTAGESKHAYALEVLAHLLGGGQGSRMHRALVETGIAVGAGAHYDSDSLGAGAFSLFGTPRREVPAERLESATDDVVQRLLDEGPTEAEVARSIRQMTAGALLSLDSLGAAPRMLGGALAIGLPLDAVEFWPARLRAVTREQVAEAARAVLPAAMPNTVGWLLPADAPAGSVRG